jgi:hypothetical protein
MSADPLPRSASSRHRASAHSRIDVWVARASADGAPNLVPLSFDWVGEARLVATPTNSPTGRNPAATRTVRLGLGHSRGASMIEGEVGVLEIDALPQQRVTGSPRAPARPACAGRLVPLVAHLPAPHQAWREVKSCPTAS